jgi:hypothetical protein
MNEGERLSKYRDNMMKQRKTPSTPTNQDIQLKKPKGLNSVRSVDESSIRQILDAVYTMGWNHGGKSKLDTHIGSISQAIEELLPLFAQRETDLLTYIADMYGLPLKELQRTVELWRKK